MNGGSLTESLLNSVCFCVQWKEARPEELMDSKLRCTFEMPLENDKAVSRSYFCLTASFFCLQTLHWELLEHVSHSVVTKQCIIEKCVFPHV